MFMLSQTRTITLKKISLLEYCMVKSEADRMILDYPQ